MKDIKASDAHLIFEAYEDGATSSRVVNPGLGSDGNGWTDQGLQELEPAELVEFIGEALPKFLQTHFEAEGYDEVKKALFNAASAINWNTSSSSAPEHNKAFPPEDAQRSWQDSGARPPGI
jgi:hypothetical protein